MSRRNTVEQPPPYKKKPGGPKPQPKEQQREIIEEARAEARTFANIPFPYAPEHREVYRQREKELLALYKLNPGKCPICSSPVSRGVIGHISKCLRTRNSNSESLPTT